MSVKSLNLTHQAQSGLPSGDSNGATSTQLPQLTNGGTSVASSVVVPIETTNAVPRKMMTKLVRRPPVDLEFSNITFTASNDGGFGSYFNKCGAGGKRILDSVSGKFSSGQLVAIMGPSGAGKSSLMNVLAGYKTSNVSGEIKINGKTRNLSKFRKMSCYIMQDDALSQHLTVAEAMQVAVNLKLEQNTPEKERELAIREIVDHLGLTECLKTRTNRISGGQRKRLSIALELVNNPPVMFFDEPTSGLDSSSCFQCITLLKQLAAEGRTIICTIHQPSARLFEMFDTLYILGEGKNVYQGPVKSLVPFLSTLGLNCPSYHNPADFVMEVVSGEYGQHLDTLVEAVRIQGNQDTASKSSASMTEEQSVPEVKVENSSRKESLGNPETSNQEVEESLIGGSRESVDDHCKTYPTSSWTQFRVLFVRTFKSIIRDETLTKLRIISHVSIGILLGLLYWDIGNEASKVYNNSAMLFFCMLFCMFTAMMPTVMTFPLEMASFKREHLNYWYSTKNYYLAKVMADMPFQILYPLTFVFIVYFMTSQPLEVERLSMFTLMCVLTSLVAQSLGLVIGCAVDIQEAVYLGPITTIPILLFSGFFVTLDNIPTLMQWLTYVAYVRYGFEGTMLAIYGFDRTTLECSVPYCHFKYPEKFLEQLALDKGVFWVDVVCLLAFFIFLRVIGYFVLKYKLWADR